MLSGSGQQCFRVAVQLLFGFSSMHQCQHRKHHSLVTGCQVVQKFLTFLALLLKIIRDNCGEVIILILFSLPVRDIGFDTKQSVFHFPHRFIRGNRDNINGQHHVAVQLTKLRYHAVFDISSVFSKEDHTPVSVAHTEAVLFKLKGVRADEVLKIVAFAHTLYHIEGKGGFFAGTVEVVEDTEFFFCFQFYAACAQAGKMSDKIRTHTGKIVPCFFDILLAHRNGHIFVLHDRVCSCCLIQQHLVVFLTVLIQTVLRHGDQNGLLKIHPVQTSVIDGELCGSAAVKCIEQFRVFQKHGFLVLTAGHGIIDVLKFKGLCVFISAHKENAIFPNRINGDDILYRLWHDKFFLILLEQGSQCFNHAAPPLFFFVFFLSCFFSFRSFRLCFLGTTGSPFSLASMLDFMAS